MRKLIYLIVVIVALGLIVAGCLPTVPPTEQGDLGTLTKSEGITIDGILSSGEWDAYLLGASVTTWGGGMSVDVYGYADDTYLYVAYETDMSQPGWSVAAGLCISANLDYKTPQSASWPDPGYTHISVYGDGFAQTDGSGWNWPDGWGNTDPSVFISRGIEYYIGEPCYGSPYPNTAEVKIPLSLLTYAGTDGRIELGGQYWQYDWAEPFFVTLPPIEIEVEIDIKPGSDPNSINLGSKGVVPVAVLTTDDFDASDIVPDTVTFAGAEPVRWTMEDVDGDGYLDILFHFKTQELSLNRDSTNATLTGETLNEVPIQGTDTVNIVPKK
ncbi:hypothetical protein ES705_51114 [subsurface metagenome]